MSKSAGKCRFGHIYGKIPFLKTSFLVQFYAYFFKNFTFAYFLGTHNSSKILLEAPGLYFLHLEFDSSHSSAFGETVVQGQHSALRLVNFGLLVKTFLDHLFFRILGFSWYIPVCSVFLTLGYIVHYVILGFTKLKHWAPEVSLRTLDKKWGFPLRVSLLYVTKPEVSCGFGHIYWKNSSWKTPFFLQWKFKSTIINLRDTLDLFIEKDNTDRNTHIFAFF